MQPPARSAAREREYKTTVIAPDKLDMLITAKNHDLKSTIAIPSRRVRLAFRAGHAADHARLQRRRKLRHLADERRVGQPAHADDDPFGPAGERTCGGTSWRCWRTVRGCWRNFR